MQVTAPVQLPSVEEPVHDVAFVVAIVSIKLLPCATVVTDGVSDAVGAGALTVTLKVAVVVPPAFVAVRVYVGVPTEGGVTETLPVRALLCARPGPEMEALVAVPAFQAMTVC